MILIGSNAYQHHFPNELLKVADRDIIANEEEREQFKGCEAIMDFQHPDFLNNSEIENLFACGEVDVFGVKVKLCSLEGLAAIKRSHLWREGRFFAKHMSAYHFKLKKYRDIAHDEFIVDRAWLTKLYVRQKSPSLRMSNKEFFDDLVIKKYDHDYIHELAAYGQTPMYTKMKRDHESAWCERDMWNEFSHQERLQCVAEEVYVIACERFMILNNWNYSAMKAYFQALEKVCTTLTSGWFRDFAIDNYPEIANMYEKTKIFDIKKMLEKNDGKEF